jgi:ketosteroid isomerase-like protein
LTPDTKQAHPNVEVLERFYAESLLAKVHRDDIEGLRSFLADDVVWRTPPGDCPPLAGEHRGLEELVEVMRTIPLPGDDAHVGEVEAIYADDNVGLALHHDVFVNGRGDKYPVAFTVVFRFSDGKIVEFDEITRDPVSMWAFIKGSQE